MRARVNPADGQVYATGLQGWNGGGRVGLRDSGVQRLRYTGKADLMVVDCRVEHDGLRIKFNQPLDVDASTRVTDYVAEHWNYHWRREYGSDMYSPTTGEVGAEDLPIESVSLGVDGTQRQIADSRISFPLTSCTWCSASAANRAGRSRRRFTGRSTRFPPRTHRSGS